MSSWLFFYLSLILSVYANDVITVTTEGLIASNVLKTQDKNESTTAILQTNDSSMAIEQAASSEASKEIKPSSKELAKNISSNSSINKTTTTTTMKSAEQVTSKETKADVTTPLSRENESIADKATGEQTDLQSCCVTPRDDDDDDDNGDDVKTQENEKSRTGPINSTTITTTTTTAAVTTIMNTNATNATMSNSNSTAIDNSTITFNATVTTSTTTATTPIRTTNNITNTTAAKNTTTTTTNVTSNSSISTTTIATVSSIVTKNNSLSADNAEEPPQVFPINKDVKSIENADKDTVARLNHMIYNTVPTGLDNITKVVTIETPNVNRTHSSEEVEPRNNSATPMVMQDVQYVGSEDKKKETDNGSMPSSVIALVTAITFAVAIILAYVTIVVWRQYLEHRYGRRELLVNDLEFDTNDLRHFEL